MTGALGTRLKEHTRTTPPLTAVGEHFVQHKHYLQMDHVQVIARDKQHSCSISDSGKYLFCVYATMTEYKISIRGAIKESE